MCTYDTSIVPATGSAKGADGWFRLEKAVVYFDHPVHALAEHTLNIDFADAAGRVAVELTADSARALAEAILDALDRHKELAV